MALSKEAGTRKLAAVMFTDIKGFSKKMSENESAAFELLKTHDALMRVIAAKYDGKIVKSIGDSFMVDFSSAVNAVKAAIDAQKRFWSFNRGKGEFDKIEVRIGIHLGDVMVSGNDMYGDGVNIASRIEAITEPNRICISADMYNQVKNKMDVKVYSMGEVRLKNIPDPVEVYEILIDSIPELTSPSQTARETLAQKTVKDSADQEAEEASSVEAAKKRGSEPVPKVQDTASLVEGLYKKAEQLFNEGKVDEAERVINEIAKIDPGYHAAMESKKAQEDKARQVHEHYERAGAYLRDGRFDLAENEVKEIFKMYPLHVGAQQLQLQIEEERYKKTEEERQQRLDQERKAREEKDRKVEDLARQAEDHIEKEEFKEAREALQAIYAVEPNFTGGERLEEKMRRGEAAKEERDRQQAFLAEQKQKEELLAQNKERQIERQQTRIRHRHEEDAEGKPKPKVLLWSAVIVVLATIAIIAYPRVKKALFPPSASIAILPFTTAQDGSGDEPLRAVLPTLLANDLTHIERVSVVVPGKANGRPAEPAQIANDLHVRYILQGSVKKADRGFTLNIRVFDAEEQAVLFSDRFDTDYLLLSQTRRQIAAKFLELANMETSAPQITSPTGNARAYELYLSGLFFTGKRTLADWIVANQCFEEAATLDSSFAAAYTGQADVRLLRIKLDGEPDEGVLREAFELNQKALRFNPREPSAYRTLAEIYFLTRRFDKVYTTIESCLALQPEDATSYGLLAQLALVEGDYELAHNEAVHAITIEPDNADLEIILGLTHHFKNDFADAIASYKRAITLGLSDSLVTARYLLNSWSAFGKHNETIQYYQNDYSADPTDYPALYWVCRAYQMMPNISAFNEWSDKSAKILQEHLEKNPLDAYAHAYFGLLLAREGKAEEGDAEMNKAIALAPNSAKVLFRQANLYAIEKKPDLAIGALRDALNRSYNFSEILNPDFTLLRNDAGFISATTRKLELK
jgi:class 3 adenylate cyclase/TolB-like protein/Flp pilus assembly protein TadD